MAGGGPLLTDVVEHDGGRHVAANSLALVERAFDLRGGRASRRSHRRTGLRRFAPGQSPSRPESAARAALTQAAGGRLPASLLAVHVAGGRAIKQWPPARFAGRGVRARDGHAARRSC